MFCFFVFLLAEGGGSGSDIPPPPTVEPDGELEITVVSSAAEDVNFLRLQFEKVQVVWRATADAPEEVLTIRQRPGSFTFFVGSQPRLVSKLTIPDGFVSQIRVISSGGQAGMKDGTLTSVTIPSGEQTGEKFVAENDQLIPIVTGIMSRLQLTIGQEDLVCNQGTGCHLKPVLHGQLVEAVTLPKEPEFIPKQVIVKMKEGVTRAEIDQLNSEIGATVIHCGWLIRGTMIAPQRCLMKIPEEMDEKEAVQFYRSSPLVKYSFLNSEGRALSIPKPSSNTRLSFLNGFLSKPSLVAAPNDPYWSNQVSLEALNIRGAWSATTGDQTVTVAVIDTGVDMTSGTNPVVAHEDLRDANVQPAATNIFADLGWDFVGDTFSTVSLSPDEVPNDMDPNGHGTFMAGMIGAVTNNNKGIAGVCWHVMLIPLKAGWGSLGKDSLNKDAVLGAIEYANSLKAHIVNMSFTMKMRVDEVDMQQTLQDISEAVNPNTLYVIASGNIEGWQAVNLDSPPSGVAFFPQNFFPKSQSIVVGASTNSQIAPTRLTSSWYGQNTVDIMAPAENVYSTMRGNIIGYAEGTSAAAAEASGVAALLMAYDSSFKGSPIATKNRILDTGDLFSSFSSSECGGGFGCKRINASSVMGVSDPKLHNISKKL